MTGNDVAPSAGIRVVAVEHAVAAPLCTRHLAELGADVVKVERVGPGDFARGYDTMVHGLSTYFVWLNHGKRSIALDLRSAEGREVFAELLRQADVLVSNLAPGAIDRIVPPDRIAELNPGLVHCVIDGYGEGGPFGQRKAYDLVVQGEAGVTANTGTPGRPAKPGVSMADLGAGTYAVAAILAALRQRDATGSGRRVGVAMLDVMGEWMMPLLLAERYGGGAPPPAGVHHQSIAPYGPFTTGDERVVNIAVQNERQWRQLCVEVLEAPDLPDDPRFLTNEDRVSHRAEVVDEVSSRVGLLSLEELTSRLDGAGIPWGRLNDLDEVLHHPQLEARSRWRQVSLDGDATATILASPLSALEAPGGGLPRVPRRGEHSREVLESLGFPDARIEELLASGVVGGPGDAPPA